jgi:hypothetical protein
MNSRIAAVPFTLRNRCPYGHTHNGAPFLGEHPREDVEGRRTLMG